MKFTTKFLTLSLVGALTTFSFVSCGDDDNAKTEPLVSIAAFVTANPDNYSSLLAALEATGLDGALADETKQYTVFAPDNDAFATLLGGRELNDIPTADLTQILLNHVIGTEIKAAAITSSGSGYVKNLASGPNGLMDTATNLSTYYNVVEGKVMINGSVEVTTPDAYDATNGVIHAVKDVIGLPTVVTFATADPNFSTLVSALTTLTPSVDFAGILGRGIGEMDSSAPFTVFAPNDAAFAKLAAVPAEADLIPILQHHVAGGANVVSSNLADPTPVNTLNGSFTINLPGNDGNPAKITSGNGTTDIDIIAVDVQASNGVIHVVESVLIPAPAVL